MAQLLESGGGPERPWPRLLRRPHIVNLKPLTGAPTRVRSRSSPDLQEYQRPVVTDYRGNLTAEGQRDFLPGWTLEPLIVPHRDALTRKSPPLPNSPAAGVGVSAPLCWRVAQVRQHQQRSRASIPSGARGGQGPRRRWMEKCHRRPSPGSTPGCAISRCVVNPLEGVPLIPDPGSSRLLS